MTLNQILETAITLAFVYSLLSIIVSSIQEFINQQFNLRGKMLYNAISDVFSDTHRNADYARAMFDHPLIDYMKEKDGRMPSYLSSQTFAESLLQTLARHQRLKQMTFVQNEETGSLTPVYHQPADFYQAAMQEIKSMHPSDLKEILQGFANQSVDVTGFKAAVARWYETYMERVQGWFQRKMRYYVFAVGLAITLMLNIDSIELAKYVWVNDAARATMVAAAETWAKQHAQQAETATPDELAQKIKATQQTLMETYPLPLGWNFSSPKSCDGCSFNFGQTLLKIFGLFITAVMISAGAPFWFSALKQLLNLKTAPAKTATSLVSETK